MAHNMLRPNIILLRDGTDSSQGIGQIVSNINACMVVVDIVRTTLGPRGMDKLIHDNGEVTITNDGATVLQKINIVHPAAKILVDIAKSQDDSVGDGTTSVVLLCGELLKEARGFIEEGVAPQTIIKGYRRASMLALDKLREIAVNLTEKTEEQKREMFIKCAETTLNSKLVADYKIFFSKMIVDACGMLDKDLPLHMIGFKKIPGGSVTDSQLVDGVAFKKTFAYAGFEQQPKKFKDAKVLLLNLELELKAEKDNAEIRISDPSQYQSIVDAEWQIIYEKLEKCVASGANCVLSKLPIGDLATQYFADRDIFCAGRVEYMDMERTAKSTGAVIQTTVNGLTPEVLGHCGVFEEVQLGSDRYNIFRECPKSKSATIILRGGAQQFLEESERSLHDAIMIVRRAMKNTKVVGGGGAIELELSRYLREYSRSVAGKDQLVINNFAKALECIPRALATNSGGDQTEIMNSLRQKHAALSKDEGRWWGVDCLNVGIQNSFENYVWEPIVTKENALNAATEAACMILSIDETITNPSSQEGGGKGKGKGKGKGGKGMRR